jgi:dihydroxyacetone kinase-like protein
VVTSADLAAGARELLRAVESEQARLNQLDAIAGDGDHGATVVMGLRAVVASLPDDAEVPPAALLRRSAEQFASVGGSTGPLWGTALLRAAQSLESSGSTDLGALAGAAEAAAAGIAMRGRCEEGDKTLLDVMAPAARALRAAAEQGATPAEAAEQVRAAAAEGLARTRELTPRRGRARRFGDRSLGYDDPGGASALLVWDVVARLAR